jgi:hypothetical protein
VKGQRSVPGLGALGVKGPQAVSTQLPLSSSLQRLRKQAEKNVEKKINKFTDVLKTHGLLV